MERKRGEGIIKVSDLFKKYTNRLQAPQKTVIKAFIEVVHDVLGADLSEDRCSYQVNTKTLALSLPGPIKSEILLHKEEILTHLKGRLGEKSAPKNIL